MNTPSAQRRRRARARRLVRVLLCPETPPLKPIDRWTVCRYGPVASQKGPDVS